MSVLLSKTNDGFNKQTNTSAHWHSGNNNKSNEDDQCFRAEKTIFFPKCFLNLNGFDFRPFNFCHLLSLVYSFIVERKTVKCLRRMKDLRKKRKRARFWVFWCARALAILFKEESCVRACTQPTWLRCIHPYFNAIKLELRPYLPSAHTHTHTHTHTHI
jgi:hypothetical protein